MKSLTVLLIEDDYSIGEVLQGAMEMEGFSTFWAKDGREGLKLVDCIDADVVVCDMMMPVLDGFGFLAEHLARPGKRAPVIAISAMTNYLSAAKASGAVAALAKPLELEELLDKVKALATSGVERPRPEPARPLLTPEVAESIERQRIEEVLRLRLEEPAPEKALHEFVAYVARLFDVPICLISTVTLSRQYWTAMCGMTGDLEAARGGPRRDSFCTHAVIAHSALIVSDAAINPFFKDNPFVTQRGIRFYAGVPLITRTGEAVGTFCLLDKKPRIFTRLDLELLSALSKRVLAELDWREKRASPGEPDATFSNLSYIDQETGLVGREGFAQVLAIQSCRQTERNERCTLAAIDIGAKPMRSVAQQLGLLFPRAWIGRLGSSRLGVVSVRDAETVSGLLKKGLPDIGKSAVLDLSRYCGASAIALSIAEDQLSITQGDEAKKAG